MDSMYIPSPNYINIFSIVGNRISRMDLTATAVLNLTVYQNKSVIDRIFCLNAVLHNSCQLQSLAKFDKFVYNSGSFRSLSFSYLVFVMCATSGHAPPATWFFSIWRKISCCLFVHYIVQTIILPDSG